MATVNFGECPKYNTNMKNEADINELHRVNRDIIKQLKRNSKEAKAMAKYLRMHMKEEEEHHKNTNTAILDMGKAITSLIADKKERDEVKDKREAIRDKVIASISVILMVGAYNFFVDVLSIKQAIGGGG
jgi:hypothetical protein